MSNRRAIVVAGLAFGDEGKGTTVEACVHQHKAPLVARYNGGAQCAHNVVAPDGKHHTFAQFGSGTLLGARTYLSEHVLVEPFALRNEAEHLRELGISDPFGLLAVDHRAPVITPYHKLANHCREKLRGSSAHGTCGMGIGETRVDALENPDEVLRVGDLLDKSVLASKLERARDRFRTEFPDENDDYSLVFVRAHYRTIAKQLHIVDGSYLAEQAKSNETIVFEGAQGALLDQTWGFQPHTTWSDTTFAWADDMLEAIEFDGEIERVGVTRAYLTRHGAGPMPTEHSKRWFAEPHNDGGFAGAFRSGDLDLTLLRYAVDICGGVDSLAVTHLDRRTTWRVCTSWGVDLPRLMQHVRAYASGTKAYNSTTYTQQERLTEELRGLDPQRFEYTTVHRAELCSMLSELFDAPVKVCSFGPTYEDKVWS